MREDTVAIERLAYGGSGFGRINGKACFVPFTAPGDVVTVRIRRETGSYAEAELIELLESSPLRVTPPCPHFGRCGGCHWQHLGYHDQVAAKEEIYAQALWRLARVERELLLPPLPAPQPWGYRSRIQLKVDSEGGELLIGFFAPGSHSVVDLPGGCAVAHPSLNRALELLRPVVAEFPHREHLPRIDLAVGDDGATVLTLHYRGEEPQRTVEFWRRREKQLAPLAGAFLRRDRKGAATKIFGEGRVTYALSPPAVDGVGAELRLGFSAGSFSQVNYRQNRLLVQTALEWGNPSGGERVLDLCCGNGNFSIPFARQVREVIGLETGEGSVADARQNAALYAMKHLRFELRDAVAGLRRFIADGEQFDLVLLDPPRSGAVEMAKLIGSVGAAKIIYVSCDPQTLGRDLAILQKGGYRVARSRVVEMFPQTYHMESITLLERV